VSGEYRTKVFRLCKGTTRRVVIIGPLAFKFPRSASGRSCNLYEAECYASASPENRHLLCPVVWSAPSGWLLVMRAAEPLSSEEGETFIPPPWDYVPHTDGCPWESKPEDWGRLQGKLVAVDYSAPALD
jgi:hypothetical protein